MRRRKRRRKMRRREEEGLQSGLKHSLSVEEI
jgi:hypothetical protein